MSKYKEEEILQDILIPIPKKVTANKVYAGMHWTVRNRIKNIFRKCIVFFQENFTKVDTTEYPVALNFVFYLRGRRLDSSNCFFMAKMLEDSLVKAEIIIDDTPDYVARVSCESHKEAKDLVRLIITKANKYPLHERKVAK